MNSQWPGGAYSNSFPGSLDLSPAHCHCPLLSPVISGDSRGRFLFCCHNSGYVNLFIGPGLLLHSASPASLPPATSLTASTLLDSLTATACYCLLPAGGKEGGRNWFQDPGSLNLHPSQVTRYRNTIFRRRACDAVLVRKVFLPDRRFENLLGE